MVGNLDLTATFMDLAAGPDSIPTIVDGKSIVSYLIPSLQRDSEPTPRTQFLIEFMAVGTYYNDHSTCWDDANHSTEKRCGGPMPRGPDPNNPLPENCVENTSCVGCGNCYFVDSTFSNNWRMLRTLDPETGEDTSFVEYDPTWKWNVSNPQGGGLQHYEFYNNSADPYQMVNAYDTLSDDQLEKYHSALAEYYACGGTDEKASNCN